MIKKTNKIKKQLRFNSMMQSVGADYGDKDDYDPFDNV